MGKFKLKKCSPLSLELKYSYEKQTTMPGKVNSASYINPSTNGPEEVTFSGKGNNPADKALNNPSKVESDLNPVQQARKDKRDDKAEIKAEGKLKRQTERAKRINQRYFGDESGKETPPAASTPENNSVMQNEQNEKPENNILGIPKNYKAPGLPMMEEKPNRAGRPIDSGIMYKTDDKTSPKSKSIKKMIEEEKFSNLASKTIV